MRCRAPGRHTPTRASDKPVSSTSGGWNGDALAKWKTPDDAVREATACSPLRCRAIDPAAVRSSGGAAGMQELLHAHATVLAILGQFSAEEQTLITYYAHRFSYAEIAKGLRMRKAAAIARHRAARHYLARRLVHRGLLEPCEPRDAAAAA